MATIEVYAPTGLTLTVNLFPYGSDTAAQSGLALTERATAKGVYTATTSALTGWHNVVILSGGSPIGSGHVYLAATGVCRVGEYVGAQDPAGVVAATWAGTTANTGLTRDRLFEAMAGVVFGGCTGGGTTTNAFKHAGTGTANITITVDRSGNRSTVVLH